jgi:hypothetical protein
MSFVKKSTSTDVSSLELESTVVSTLDPVLSGSLMEDGVAVSEEVSSDTLTERVGSFANGSAHAEIDNERINEAAKNSFFFIPIDSKMIVL